jgi:hypothetical protein
VCHRTTSNSSLQRRTYDQRQADITEAIEGGQLDLGLVADEPSSMLLQTGSFLFSIWRRQLLLGPFEL